MQNLWVIRGQCKWGTGQGRFLHIYKTGRHIFLENIYMGHIYTFSVHFYALFFTLDTICADNKDKPMAAAKIN